MRSVLLSLFLLSACRTPSVAEPSAPKPAPAPTPEEEIAALLQSIPPDCVAPTTAPSFECPRAFTAPAGSCVVERTDTRSGRVTDWLVYVDGLLVRQELTLSSTSRAVTESSWDTARRLVSKTTCFTSSGGEPDWSPTWRPVDGASETPLQEAVQTSVHFSADEKRAKSADVTLRSANGETKQVRICSTWDGERKTRRVQTARNGVASMLIEVRAYEFKQSLLSAIDVNALSLKGTSVAGKNHTHVEYTRDASGRLSAWTAGPAHGQYLWDARGRLVAFNEAMLGWNDEGRLVKLELGDPALDATFTWDTGGRIESAHFANGEGYRVTYSAACPRELRADGLTPSAAPFLSWEGPDEL
jgi:hypothetical protein